MSMKVLQFLGRFLPFQLPGLFGWSWRFYWWYVGGSKRSGDEKFRCLGCGGLFLLLTACGSRCRHWTLSGDVRGVVALVTLCCWLVRALVIVADRVFCSGHNVPISSVGHEWHSRGLVSGSRGEGSGSRLGLRVGLQRAEPSSAQCDQLRIPKAVVLARVAEMSAIY